MTTRWWVQAVSVTGMAVLAGACGGSAKSAAPPATTRPAQTTVTAPPAAPADPAQLLGAAEQDAAAAGWTHTVVTFDSGGVHAVYVQDDGPGQGRQDVTVDGSHHLQALVVGGTAYFKADQVAASTYMQLPAATVNQIAGKWVQVPSTDQGYSSVAADIDLAAVLADTTPSAPLTETAATTVDGQKVLGISGGLPAVAHATGTCTLYVSAGAHPVPVAFTTTASGSPARVDFSRWGVTQTLTAPAGAIPASSVGL